MLQQCPPSCLQTLLLAQLRFFFFSPMQSKRLTPSSALSSPGIRVHLSLLPGDSPKSLGESFHPQSKDSSLHPKCLASPLRIIEVCELRATTSLQSTAPIVSLILNPLFFHHKRVVGIRNAAIIRDESSTNCYPEIGNSRIFNLLS